MIFSAARLPARDTAWRPLNSAAEQLPGRGASEFHTAEKFRRSAPIAGSHSPAPRPLA